MERGLSAALRGGLEIDRGPEGLVVLGDLPPFVAEFGLPTS
ncbi:hypothetical protein [Desulfovibrio aminophilus]